MKKLLLTTAIAVIALSLNTNAQVILSWNTFGNAGTETSQASSFNNANLGSSTLTLGAGVTAAANTHRFGGSNWFDTGDTNPTTLAESIAGNDFIQFTITPNSGYQFTLTNLSFIWDFSGTGPNSVAIRSSLDSYGSNLGSLTSMTASTTAFKNMTISGITDISSAVTFRIYGFGATSTAGTGGFDSAPSVTSDNVQLIGSVTAIPEPSTYALIALGLGGLFLARRFQRPKASKASA